MPEVHDQRERVLTLEEESQLIDVSPEPLKTVLIISLNTGMRLGEIPGLRWEWTDLKDNFIFLPQTHTKSKEARRVPINPVVRKLLLEKRLESGGSEFVFPRTFKYDLIGKIRRSFKTACVETGIVCLRFHDLRHTAATRMIESDVHIEKVSKILGHSSIQMTMRYAHPEDSLRDAVETLANFTSNYSQNCSQENLEE